LIYCRQPSLRTLAVLVEIGETEVFVAIFGIHFCEAFVSIKSEEFVWEDCGFFVAFFVGFRRFKAL
jgi:hypothetical protein